MMIFCTNKTFITITKHKLEYCGMKCYSYCRIVFAHPLYGFTDDILQTMFRCRRSSTYSHQTKNSRFCAARRKTLSTLLLFPLYPENKHCLFKDVSNPLHGSAACKGVPSVNRYPPVPPPAYLGKYIRFWTKIIATIVIVKLIQAQYLHSPKNLQDVHSKWSLKSTSLQLQHICP